METTELMQQYAVLEQERSRLQLQLDRLSDAQKVVAAELAQRIPAESTSMGYTLTNGVKVVVEKKTTSRFVPVDGQSDNFWGWVKENAKWDLVGRTVLQKGVSAYLEAHKTLPPHLRTMTVTEPTIRVTFTNPSTN